MIFNSFPSPLSFLQLIFKLFYFIPMKITISGQAPGKKPPAQSPLEVTPPLPVPLPDAKTWICEYCNDKNEYFRIYCVTCKDAKPIEAKTVGEIRKIKGALPASKSGIYPFFTTQNCDFRSKTFPRVKICAKLSFSHKEHSF